jgi:hypothetical protein
MTGARNVKGGLLLLSVGLAAGLAMSVYAFAPVVPVPTELAHYDDLPRRLIRLAHIAAIMLPLINIVVGPWLDRLHLSPSAREAGSWLLLGGAAGLPLTLALEAFLPILIPWHFSAPPALAFCLAVFLTATGAFRTDFPKEVSHAHDRGYRGEGEGDHRRALQAVERRRA